MTWVMEDPAPPKKVRRRWKAKVLEMENHVLNLGVNIFHV